LSAGLLGILLAQHGTASEPLAVEFLSATASAACAFAWGRPIMTKGLSGNSTVIAGAILRGMFLAKIRNATLCFVGAGLILIVLAWSLLPGRAATAGGASGVAGGDPGQDGDPNNNDPARPGAAVKENKDDKELLQGEWQGTTIEMPGEILQIGPDKGIAYHFDGDNVKVVCTLFAGWSGDYVLRLDSQARPKRLDLLVKEKDGRVRENDGLVGIYELDGDNLRFCLAAPRDGRPTEFVAKRGQFIWVFKRDLTEKTKEMPKQP